MDKELATQCNDALDIAKIQLLSSKGMTFLANLFMQLKFKWSDELPTAGVDGESMLMNPQFFLSLPKDERVGLLAHETWHVALMHMYRRGSRDAEIYNHAGDYVINSIITKAGITMPKGGILDSQYDGMATDEVYEVLVKNKKNNPPPPNPMAGDVMDPVAGGTQEAKTASIVGKAYHTTKMQQSGSFSGTGSAEADRIIDELFNPKLPWRKILRNRMTIFKKDDYSTRRFNKRFLPTFYLPTLYSEALPDIHVYIDTSCSVTPEDFKSFISECNGVKRLLKPTRMSIRSFDTKLYPAQVFRPSQKLTDVKFLGGGGTDIGPALQDIVDTKPSITLIFTDGYYRTHSALEEEAHKSSNVHYLIFYNKGWTTTGAKVIHFDI